MTHDELQELHFIAPIGNVPSIMKFGVLSHARAAKLQHCSIAMQEIQDRRVRVVVPGTGKKLHQYANLYLCARNPMLYMRKHEEICVLAVSTDVLELPGVIITDQNAAGEYVSFRPVLTGLSHVSRDLTFARRLDRR